MANAIVGTLILIGIASVVGLPVGIGAGLYLAERRGTKLADLVRFLADVLNGLPSIVMGIFAWQLLVRPVGHFSALAGRRGHRGDDDPAHHAHDRGDGAHGAAVAARGGAGAGLSALAHLAPDRAAHRARSASSPGCSWPSRGSRARRRRCCSPCSATTSGPRASTQPIAALPLQIFTYANSPYDEWHALAWAGALVLIGLVLVISVIARVVTRVETSEVVMTDLVHSARARHDHRHSRAPRPVRCARWISNAYFGDVHAVRNVNLDVPCERGHRHHRTRRAAASPPCSER